MMPDRKALLLGCDGAITALAEHPKEKVDKAGPPLRPMGPPRPGAEGLRPRRSATQTDGALPVLGGAAFAEVLFF